VTLAFLLSLLIAAGGLIGQTPNGDVESYRKQIEAWRAERVAKLKADGGC